MANSSAAFVGSNPIGRSLRTITSCGISWVPSTVTRIVSFERPPGTTSIASHGEFRRTSKATAQVRTQSVRRDRGLERDIGVTARHVEALGEQIAPELVDPFEEAALNVHQVRGARPLALLAAPRCRSDDISRTPAQLVEALRADSRPVRLAEQLGELRPELGAQLGSRLPPPR